MRATVVRTTRDRGVLDEWCLVLTAADIPYETGADAGGYTLAVDAAVARRVVEVLSSYDDERRQKRRNRRIPAARSANVAWIVATAILIGHMYIGAVERDSVSFTRGAARATAIRDGELWRSVTALTLHADAMHAVSNAVSALLFLSPLCQLVGGGTALALTTFSGAGATLLNAFLRRPSYTGIGASTAIFAALGLLVGMQAAHGGTQPLWRRLRPLGAGLAILAMLGASPETDVTAHLLGLAAGTATGAAFASRFDVPLSRRSDLALGLAAAAVIAGAWWIARMTA